MSSTLGIFLILFVFYPGQSTIASLVSDTSCKEDQLKRCADNAEPLLKNSDLVVPDNQRTVNQVCSLWSDLTLCISNYTVRCMSRQQRMEFDRTFKDPVSSMSTLCQNPDHRKEYLNNAPCVKQISTDGNYCGNQYRFLIDLVSGSTSTIKQICCARAKFKNCILSQTPTKCDLGRRPSQLSNSGRRLSDSMNATTMAVSILDKSLAFIGQRCSSSSFHEADCPGIDAKVLRTNSKGPLESSEMETAASGEKATASQGSHFQLGQGSKFNLTADKILASTRRPTTTKRITEERPKTDKLSSSNSQGNVQSVQNSRPGTQYGNDKNDKSGSNSLGAKSHYWLHFGIISLFGFHMFFENIN